LGGKADQRSGLAGITPSIEAFGEWAGWQWRSSGLENARDGAHIWGMADFEKCSGDLRRLIGIADANGVPTAERSIDEYLAATEPSKRTGALQEVKQVVQTHRDAATSGDQRDFAEVVNDYIEKLMRSFE
jgi:hypothetical protein